LRSAFLRPLESKPPDHGVFAEAGTNAVNRMLDLDWPVVDEIAGIGMIRRCEPTYADAEEAEFGAVGFAFEKAACGGENLGGELRRRTERIWQASFPSNVSMEGWALSSLPVGIRPQVIPAFGCSINDTL
jgi:hypothetical protein